MVWSRMESPNGELLGPWSCREAIILRNLSEIENYGSGNECQMITVPGLATLAPSKIIVYILTEKDQNKWYPVFSLQSCCHLPTSYNKHICFLVRWLHMPIYNMKSLQLGRFSSLFTVISKQISTFTHLLRPGSYFLEKTIAVGYFVKVGIC